MNKPDLNEKATIFNFQTESEQLLNLMIHSLYSNKEIFLRELISNASDAIEKLRFFSLKTPELLENDIDLNIIVEINKKKKTISVIDNGIGMTKEEISKNLGTIAKSGTKEFLNSLPTTENEKARAIGKFGVGFYSSFIVAEKIQVYSKKAGSNTTDGILWESTGKSSYTIKSVDNLPRGTTVTLFLKENEEEFLNYWKLKNIIVKYSDHITIPILMKKKETDTVKEIINNASALWTLPKIEITEKQYCDLYKSISNDFNDPMLWMHNNVEGTIHYTNLLFIPSKLSTDLWSPEKAIGLKLYVQRVFIMSEVKSFLPNYLRFICGIVDSEDIKINISRETIQDNIILKKIKTSITQRILTTLENLSNTNKKKYNIFWKEFGQILKEGLGEDFVNKEKLANLLRFTVRHGKETLQNVSLKEYTNTILEKQTKIYYITAETYDNALNNPHLEIFEQKFVKVLLLCDRIDEWLVVHLTEYLGYKLQSIVKSGIENDFIYEEKKENIKLEENTYKDLIKQLKECLVDNIKDVRITMRLINSPSCIVLDELDMSLEMTRIIKATGQHIRKSKPILEINAKHKVIKYLMTLIKNKEKFSLLANIIFEQALITEGGKLDNPAQFVKNINFILEGLIKN